MKTIRPYWAYPKQGKAWLAEYASGFEVSRKCDEVIE